MSAVGQQELTAGDSTNTSALLEVEGLAASAQSRGIVTHPLQAVSFSVPGRSFVGLVGESGSGKSLTASTILGLLPKNIQPTGGRVLLQGRDLLGLTEKEFRRVRGAEISGIFQDAKGSLNPIISVGQQISEVLRVHERLEKADAWKQSVELLGSLGIRDPERRARDYPHQYSGGMAQRAALARAIACSPKLLIADEPTTGLDATVQVEVLELLEERLRARGASLLLISHDIGVIGALCDAIVVMYAGMVLEAGPSARVLENALSPYTRALIECFRPDSRGRTQSIPGTPPTVTARHTGCPFSDRCAIAQSICADSVPALRERETGHWVACHLA